LLPPEAAAQGPSPLFPLATPMHLNNLLESTYYLNQGFSNAGKFTPWVKFHLSLGNIQWCGSCNTLFFPSALVSKQKQGVNFVLGSWQGVNRRKKFENP